MGNGEVDYRRCNVGDADVLCALGMYTFRDTFSVCTAEDDMVAYLVSTFNRERAVASLSNPDSLFMLATVDGTPAGYLKVNMNQAQTEPMGSSYLEVQRLYVIPEFKRRHIGTEFLNLAFETAGKLGLPHVWLGVWEHNEPAKALYQSMGFSFFSRHTFQVGNDPQTDLLMRADVPSGFLTRREGQR